MISALFIIAGFFILIYGANFLVDGASSLAGKLKVPNIVIGLTIVAFGTSAPELVVNTFAAIKGNPQIVLGNVIGSNIFNIAAILGICSIIYPLTVKTNTTWVEVPLALLSAVVVLVLANDFFFDQSTPNSISRSEGVILLLFFVIFLAYNIHLSMGGKNADEVTVKDYAVGKSVLLVILGFIMLVAGGKLIVDYAVKVAQLLGWSERVIALTIVSVGTSLPELATSLVAVKKKNVDIAVGNVVGSNIFNIFFILGISASITAVPLSPENQFDLLVNIFASFLLFIFIFSGKGRKVDRWEGILFVLLYISYIVSLLV
jgi:cation:H+ antiporter